MTGLTALRFLFCLALTSLFVGCSSTHSMRSGPIAGGRTIVGMASFYGGKFNGRKTASGQTFDVNKLTAAHRTLPFGQKVRVTNLQNKRTVDVVINDRGPYARDYIIDLTPAAARRLDMIRSGKAKVSIEPIK